VEGFNSGVKGLILPFQEAVIASHSVLRSHVDANR
jgi:hypothetical protein